MVQGTQEIYFPHCTHSIDKRNWAYKLQNWKVSLDWCWTWNINFLCSQKPLLLSLFISGSTIMNSSINTNDVRVAPCTTHLHTCTHNLLLIFKNNFSHKFPSNFQIDSTWRMVSGIELKYQRFYCHSIARHILELKIGIDFVQFIVCECNVHLKTGVVCIGIGIVWREKRVRYFQAEWGRESRSNWYERTIEFELTTSIPCDFNLFWFYRASSIRVPNAMPRYFRSTDSPNEPRYTSTPYFSYGVKCA